jgi:choline dehydrogenase-like flavoprotein
MDAKWDFIIVGSGGGGGTLAWVLAKGGYKVLILEQGPDFAEEQRKPLTPGDPSMHDEYRFRLEKPDPKRRLRGDYNTFWDIEKDTVAPFDGGWTGSVVGGGSMLWGTWAFRPLPIDFRLKTFYHDVNQLKTLAGEGYSIADWPLDYAEMMPFFNVAETLMGVSGDRPALNASIRESTWYTTLKGKSYWGGDAEWFPSFNFPMPPYPLTPVGRLMENGFTKAGMHAFRLPVAIVHPDMKNGFGTRDAIAKALAGKDGPPGDIWKTQADQLWSDKVREACNMCGFCGEYLCWRGTGSKWGTQDSTLKEIRGASNVVIHPNAKAIEVTYDARKKRATGVRYLDLTDKDNPRAKHEDADYVIVSCGAVQSARLLLLSGPPSGLANSSGQVGRHATFHLFGFSATAVLNSKFDGLLHGEFGPTGNVSTFASYFIEGPPEFKWIKGGHLTSTAKKNPLEDATKTLAKSDRKFGAGKEGLFGALNEPKYSGIADHNRRVEIRLTADDLPMHDNRVTLDPTYVDEYGIPVARVARRFGANEKRLFQAGGKVMMNAFKSHFDNGIFAAEPVAEKQARLNLIGDHQMGTCRMGDDPKISVVNRFCRSHDVENLFIVDSSFMPTGLGLNPMVAVVANALRVGTHIVDALKRGEKPGKG